MISPYQLLQESGFSQYTAMVRFKYDRENTSLGAEKLAEMVRAIPGSTRVSTVSLDKHEGIAIFNVKLISSKTPKQAFLSFKENALSRFRGMLLSVEVGAGTIEKKGDFIVQESKKPRTHLGDYLGQLIEEGLLLEVSIDELRRQYLECDPPKLTPEVFEQIVQACENKSNYATWLCKKVSTNMVTVEDLEQWHDILMFFDRYKQRFEKKDINQVKTAEDITAFMADYQRVQDEVEHKKMTGSGKKDEKPEKKEEEEPLEEGQIGFLTTSDGRVWKVYNIKPGQWDLERKIGAGANWCTVSSLSYFDQYLTTRYNGQDPDPNYYIFVDKKNPETKYQIHIASDQCKDKKDHEVNYALPFIQEFYQYLHEKHGVDYSRGVRAGQQLLEMAKVIANEAKELSNTNTSSVTVADGEAFAIYVKGEKEHLVQATAQLSKAFGCTVESAASFILSLLSSDRGDHTYPGTLSSVHRNFVTDFIYVLNTKSTRDVVIITRVSEQINLLASLLLGGTDFTFTSNFDYPDRNLARCNVNNLDSYKDLAKHVHAGIKKAVQLRNNKHLPGLKHYRVKADGHRRLYEFSTDEQTIRARLEVGLPEYFTVEAYNEKRLQPIKCYLGPECFGDRGPIVVRQDGISLEGSSWNYDSTEENLKSFWPVFDFIFGKDKDIPSNISSMPGVLAASIGLRKVGSIENLIEEAKKCPNSPIENTSLRLYTSTEDFKEVFKRFNPHTSVSEFSFVGDDTIIFVSTYNSVFVVWKPKEYLTNLESLDSQSELVSFIRSKNVSLDDLTYLYRELGGDLDEYPALSGLVSRAAGVTVMTVPRYLKKNSRSLQNYNLPLRTNLVERHYGVYGSWEQLKDLIKFSSNLLYQKVMEVKDESHTDPSDVVLYWYDTPRDTWNALVRFINNGQVVAWAKRSGSKRWLNVTGREIPEDMRVDAGDLPASNYATEQPRQARAANQPQAQGEAPTQTLGELDQYRANSQNSEELYVVPREDVRTALTQAGFTNLAAAFGEDHQKRAIIYKAYSHRGGTIEYVAIVYGAGATVVAGYPRNSSYIEASNNSEQWRRLTRELDNSTRTFQQCVDVCSERHIPLPQALQGWLAYRGE